ncbi:MAG: helix-turn-helix domain-containing protein [Burkholderiaceae bacterium]
MNQSQLVLDQVRAMGLILRDARLARDINPRDLETELRTTYRHLLAIEEGQMRLFYSDSFFCDLFTRYAVQLGFSSEQAQDMRLALHGEGPLVASEPEEVESEPEPEHDSEPKPESSPALESDPASDQDAKPELSPAAELSPAPESDPASEREAKQKVQLEPEPTRSSDASQSLGSLWFWGAIAIGLVLAVVILTLEASPEASNPVAAEKPQVSVKPTTVPEKPTTSPESAPAATSAEASAATLTSPAATPTSSPATSEAEQQEPVAAPAPEPPKERRVSESILVSALDAPASFTAGAAMAIRFNVKGWVWVREFDDNVREFVVQPGQTVRFSELPIFLVVPFPDQLSVSVDSRPVTLRRNDDEKNHARYSRSMLRGLVSNP